MEYCFKLKRVCFQAFVMLVERTNGSPDKNNKCDISSISWMKKSQQLLTGNKIIYNRLAFKFNFEHTN